MDVVANSVEGTSHRDPSRTWAFRSEDGLRYTVSEAPCQEIGTEVVLHLSVMHRQLADPDEVRAVLPDWDGFVGGNEMVLHRALGLPVVDGVRFGALALTQRWAEANPVTLDRPHGDS